MSSLPSANEIYNLPYDKQITIIEKTYRESTAKQMSKWLGDILKEYGAGSNPPAKTKSRLLYRQRIGSKTAEQKKTMIIEVIKKAMDNSKTKNDDANGDSGSGSGKKRRKPNKAFKSPSVVNSEDEGDGDGGGGEDTRTPEERIKAIRTTIQENERVRAAMLIEHINYTPRLHDVDRALEQAERITNKDNKIKKISTIEKYINRIEGYIVQADEAGAAWPTLEEAERLAAIIRDFSPEVIQFIEESIAEEKAAGKSTSSIQDICREIAKGVGEGTVAEEIAAIASFPRLYDESKEEEEPEAELDPTTIKTNKEFIEGRIDKLKGAKDVLLDIHKTLGLSVNSPITKTSTKKDGTTTEYTVTRDEILEEIEGYIGMLENMRRYTLYTLKTDAKITKYLKSKDIAPMFEDDNDESLEQLVKDMKDAAGEFVSKRNEHLKDESKRDIIIKDIQNIRLQAISLKKKIAADIEANREVILQAFISPELCASHLNILIKHCKKYQEKANSQNATFELLYDVYGVIASPQEWEAEAKAEAEAEAKAKAEAKAGTDDDDEELSEAESDSYNPEDCEPDDSLFSIDATSFKDLEIFSTAEAPLDALFGRVKTHNNGIPVPFLNLAAAKFAMVKANIKYAYEGSMPATADRTPYTDAARGIISAAETITKYSENNTEISQKCNKIKDEMGGMLDATTGSISAWYLDAQKAMLSEMWEIVKAEYEKGDPEGSKEAIKEEAARIKSWLLITGSSAVKALRMAKNMFDTSAPIKRPKPRPLKHKPTPKPKPEPGDDDTKADSLIAFGAGGTLDAAVQHLLQMVATDLHA